MAWEVGVRAVGRYRSGRRQVDEVPHGAERSERVERGGPAGNSFAEAREAELSGVGGRKLSIVDCGPSFIQSLGGGSSGSVGCA